MRRCDQGRGDEQANKRRRIESNNLKLIQAVMDGDEAGVSYLLEVGA